MRSHLLTAILLASLLAASGAVVWQYRQLDAAHRRESEDAASLKQLRSRLRDVQLHEPSASTPPPGEPSAPSYASGRPSAKTASLVAQREAEIGRLQRELNDSHIALHRLEARVASFDEERAQATASANERFTTAQNDYNAHFDELTRQLQTAQNEAQSARQHLADFQAAADKLKSTQSSAAAQLAESTRLLATLQDLNRRRDGYISSILRRYRDLTEQFRAMSGVLAASRDQNSSALSESGLTRIQSAISQADDDLRQLNELNARALQVEKKLAKP